MEQNPHQSFALAAATVLVTCLAFAPLAAQERIRTVFEVGDFVHPDPPLDVTSLGDNTDDAAGLGQLFESIEVPGVTDRPGRTESVAAVYMDGDDLLDLVVSYDNQIEVLLNQGGFEFHPTDPIVIERDPGDPPPGDAYYTAAADFNGDGVPDFYWTASGSGGRAQFLVSQGTHTHYRELAVPMGITNGGAYVRNGVAIADVNGDDWLDIGVSAKQVAERVTAGWPHSRLYVFVPEPGGDFEDGHFVDIGGSARMPGFGDGTENMCDRSTDYASTMIKFRDLDDDGDLDVIQNAGVDLNTAECPDCACSPGFFRHGTLAWRNGLAETGQFRFRELAPGAGAYLDDDDDVLPEQGRSVWDADLGYYVHETPALSHMDGDLDAIDVDNDGDLDVLSVGSVDPIWQLDIPPEQMGSKFWRNDGNWRFTPATEAHGFDVLHWNFDAWSLFWDGAWSDSPALETLKKESIHHTLVADDTVGDQHFYATAFIAGDFDNDGWIDGVQLDRFNHFLDANDGFLRSALLLNNRDGSFRPLMTTRSGISRGGMAGVTADLNNDGRLDLVVINRISTDQVYWNTGGLAGAQRHWLMVRLAGREQRRLIGARVFLYDQTTQKLLGRRDYFPQHNSKSSRDPFVHFGLGTRGDGPLAIQVRLPGGHSEWFVGIDSDRMVELTLLPEDS